ncbi:MAG: hypothetical protein M3P50_06030, partial [Actinomycetota bacterium]|nr:hypothetical protein [Actinomycetota bacterium]
MRSPALLLSLVLVGLTGCGDRGGAADRRDEAATAVPVARVAAPVQVGRTPIAVATGFGAVWVLDQSGGRLT